MNKDFLALASSHAVALQARCLFHPLLMNESGRPPLEPFCGVHSCALHVQGVPCVAALDLCETSIEATLVSSYVHTCLVLLSRTRKLYAVSQHFLWSNKSS